jgi:putative aldouronate transport system permease protein
MTKLKNNSELMLLFLPGFLLILLLSYVPMFGVIIAFKDYRVDLGILGSEWTGFKNFEFFFRSDTFYLITRNTVLYNVAFLILTTGLAIALAIMLNELTKRWIKFHQTMLFIPFFMSWVLVGYIANSFFDHENGFLNRMLHSIGSEGVMWYFEAKYWPYILIVFHLWKSIGFSTLIYYAGLMGIDSTYYEAAKIDGANKRQLIRHITIPMLTPLITILLILSIGNMFRGDFGLHYFVPNNSGLLYPSTDVIDTYVFRALRSIGDVSMSAAVGLYQSLVGLILVVVANLVIRKVNEENSLW